MTTEMHPLDAATCPQCDRTARRFRRYGGRLICEACYQTEQAKNAACTCDTYGDCDVCRPEPDFEEIARQRAEAHQPWWENDPMFDGWPHGRTVPDHLTTGAIL